MSEHGELSTEKLVLSQVGNINRALEEVTGGVVPKVSENSIHWISTSQANEIRQLTGDTSLSPAFAYRGDIYFVRELFKARVDQMKDFPPPMCLPDLHALFTIAHEALHNGCPMVDGGQPTKYIGKEAWNAEYDCAVNQSGEHVPKKVKEQFRKVNDEITSARENIVVKVGGASLLLGSKEKPLYRFGLQIDEDLTDFLASRVLFQAMRKVVKPGKKDHEEELQRQLWLLNINNRQSSEPQHVTSLYRTLTDFLRSDDQQRRFNRSYFTGQFYEEYVPGLSDRQRNYFIAYVAADATTEALEVLMGKRP